MKTITSVRKYIVDNNNNLYCLKDNVVEIYGENLLTFQVLNFNSGTFYLVNDIVFSGKSFYIENNQVKEIQDLEGDYFSGIFYKNMLLFTNERCIFYDFSTKRKILEVDFYSNKSIYKIYETWYICHGGNFISANVLSTGTELWRKEFTADVDKVESFGEDLVLVALSGVHARGVVCGVSAKDGSTLWEVEGGYLHVYEGRIFAVGYHTDVPYQLLEIDPLTGIPKTYLLADVLKQNGLSEKLYSDYQVVGNLIYLSFFDHKTLVVINLEELRLEWQHKVETQAEYIRIPKVAGNRLYVLDEGSTLHIFEREL